VAAFEDCGTLTAASASTGAINLLGGKVRRVRAVCLPASEGVGPGVRIRLAPAASLRTLGPPRDERGRLRTSLSAWHGVGAGEIVAWLGERCVNGIGRISV
jgi:hypothetical protein